MPKSAPRKLRATLAIIAVGCVPVGGALAGFVAAALVPQYGWQILFHIGGVAPIVIAIAAHVRPAGIDQVHDAAREPARQDGKLIASIRPDFKVPPNARFVIEDEKQFPELQSASICSATGCS